MKKLFICFGIILCFVACRKVTDNNNAPSATGSISGNIQPAGAVTKITASDATGKTYSAIPDSTGKFLLSALPPGQYTVSFAIESPFSPSGFLPSSTNVKSNEVTNLGVLRFEAKPQDASNATVNGSVVPKEAFGLISLTSANAQHSYTGCRGLFPVYKCGCKCLYDSFHG